jgi:hypothetical protein
VRKAVANQPALLAWGRFAPSRNAAADSVVRACARDDRGDHG